VHHQVIPVTFISQLAKGDKNSTPAFIFLHMSGLETHYLEHAHIWQLEEKIASKVLFISDRTKYKINKLSLDTKQVDTGYYRNPAPIVFEKNQHVARDVPQDILIVSNHPPSELTEAASMLRKQGYRVTLMGEGQSEYKLVSPEFLNNFDVVVTIGKTVQYCLVMSMPVYLYDVWGGPGYLSENNISLAKQRNFSGRGFDKKNPETIAKEIIEDYLGALQYQRSIHEYSLDNFTIRKVLPEILSGIKKKRLKQFSPYYEQFLIAILTMLKYKFYHENLLIFNQVENKRLNGENSRLTKNLEDTFVEFEHYKQSIRTSPEYKVGKFVVRPARAVKRFIKRKK
ncbi:MAG: hypothetical protein ACREGE_00590, partial [Candidatus Microsaccharimonas sp.]